MREEEALRGKDLIQLLTENAGAESNEFTNQFALLMDRHQVTPSELSLDDLRRILAEELQDLFLEIQTGAKE